MASIIQTGESVWRVQIAKLGTRLSATFRTKREAVAWAGATEHRIINETKHRRDLEKKIGASRSPIPASEILSNRVTAQNVPGIYILFDGDMVTYVGQSKNVLHRLASHSSKGRTFTSYYVIPCLIEDLNRMELHYINALSPPENKPQIGVSKFDHSRPTNRPPCQSESSQPCSA